MSSLNLLPTLGYTYKVFNSSQSSRLPLDLASLPSSGARGSNAEHKLEQLMLELRSGLGFCDVIAVKGGS